MNAHLIEISKGVAKDAHAILVLDGAGWHSSEALEVSENISLLKLPPYAPELNPVENVWAYIRSNKLAITVFDTYDEIVTKCCDAWNFFANDTDVVKSIASQDYAKTVNLWGDWYYGSVCILRDATARLEFFASAKVQKSLSKLKELRQ